MARKFYDILQIQPEASTDEIQSAYRRLALRYHPDHNASPEAASQMMALNEAYEALHTGAATHTVRRDDLTESIVDAARAVILRHGWTLSHDDGRVAIFEFGRSSIQVALIGRLTGECLNRLSRPHPSKGRLTAIFAVHVDAPVVVGTRLTVIDLMRVEPHGAPTPDGPCKSLLAGFL